jgi:hypothetical protein
VTGLLPEWPDTWGGSCSAFRNLSPDESSFSIRKFKWRISHPPTGTCYLKVWLNRVFTPETGDPTITPLTPYEWSSSGNPCFSDTEKPPGHEDNKIVSSTTTEDVPGTDGTVSIEIAKWSCVPGYEPDISDPENPQANGFPDPSWEAAA